MTMVTIVEVRMPQANPSPQNSNVESDLAFVGSSRASALSFIADHPNYSTSSHPWCWYVYDVTLDDPKSIPHDHAVIGQDGQSYPSQKDAWDACSTIKASAGPR